MKNIIRITKKLLFLIILLFISYRVIHVDEHGMEGHVKGAIKKNITRPDTILEAEYKEDTEGFNTEVNIVDTDVLVKKLPGVAIVGVKKCGTIALSQMLKMHPKIETPTNPEIWFWTLWNQFKKGLHHYKVQQRTINFFLSLFFFPRTKCL